MSRGEDEIIAIGLGSNLGGRRENLSRAVRELTGWPGIALRAASSIYETDPVGPQDQGRFLNAVITVTADWEPEALLDRLLALELELGRVRERHWGPRVIDLDLLLWGQRVIDTQRLKIPHPEMTGRGFVLAPLAEIAPQARHPLTGRTTAELLADLKAEGGLGGVEVRIEADGWLS